MAKRHRVATVIPRRVVALAYPGTWALWLFPKWGRVACYFNWGAVLDRRYWRFIDYTPNLQKGWQAWSLGPVEFEVFDRRAPRRTRRRKHLFRLSAPWRKRLAVLRVLGRAFGFKSK